MQQGECWQMAKTYMVTAHPTHSTHTCTACTIQNREIQGCHTTERMGGALREQKALGRGHMGMHKKAYPHLPRALQYHSTQHIHTVMHNMVCLGVHSHTAQGMWGTFRTQRALGTSRTQRALGRGHLGACSTAHSHLPSTLQHRGTVHNHHTQQ